MPLKDEDFYTNKDLEKIKNSKKKLRMTDGTENTTPVKIDSNTTVFKKKKRNP